MRQLQDHELVPDGFECDGCSGGAPDEWRGLHLWPACAIHDAGYEPTKPYGGTWAGRRECDAVLRRNLRWLLRYQAAPWHLVHGLPWLYWGRVRLWGAGAYFFDAGEQPASWWQRFREVYGFFRVRMFTRWAIEDRRLDRQLAHLLGSRRNAA